jgi:hypothetical protein
MPAPPYARRRPLGPAHQHNAGLTTYKNPTGAPTQVLLNPDQNAADVAATFVHEMAHASYPYLNHLDVYLEEIKFYNQLSAALKKPVMYAPYIGLGIAKLNPATGTYVFSAPALVQYVKNAESGSGGTAGPPVPPPLLPRGGFAASVLAFLSLDQQSFPPGPAFDQPATTSDKVRGRLLFILCW